MKSSFLSRFVHLEQRYCTWKNISIVSIFYVLSLLLLSYMRLQNETLHSEGILDMMPFKSSPEIIYNYLTRLGSHGRYIHMLCSLLDFCPHMLCYTTWMTLLSVKLFARRRILLCKVCVALVLLTYIFDVLETLDIISLLQVYPQRLDSFASVLSYLTISKLVAFVSYFAVLGFGVYQRSKEHHETTILPEKHIEDKEPINVISTSA
jgi:hypothetical protein